MVAAQASWPPYFYVFSCTSNSLIQLQVLVTHSNVNFVFPKQVLPRSSKHGISQSFCTLMLPAAPSICPRLQYSHASTARQRGLLMCIQINFYLIPGQHFPKDVLVTPVLGRRVCEGKDFCLEYVQHVKGSVKSFSKNACLASLSHSHVALTTELVFSTKHSLIP